MSRIVTIGDESAIDRIIALAHTLSGPAKTIHNKTLQPHTGDEKIPNHQCRHGSGTWPHND